MLSLIFPKKGTKKIDLTTMISQVDLFSFGVFFWKNLKTQKRHFEIKWPLGYLLLTATSKLIHLYHTVTDLASFLCHTEIWTLKPQTILTFWFLQQTILLGGIQFGAIWQQLQNCTKFGPKSKPKSVVSIQFCIKICFVTLN